MHLPEQSQPDAVEHSLVSIARAGCACLLDTSSWLHRRVDKVSYTGRALIRREISVDFSIPAGYPASRALQDGTQVYWVPILFLRKWPPLMRLDLRTQEGMPIPLLLSAENRIVDAEALMGLTPDGPLRTEVEKHLRDVALKDRPAAGDALDAATATIESRFLELGAHEQLRWLEVLIVASRLGANSLLWTRVVSRSGQRQIVKVCFEHPTTPDLILRRRLLTSMSWAPMRTHLSLPNVGEGTSYHLQFDPPMGFQVHRARMELLDPLDRPDPPEPERWWLRLNRRRHDLWWTLINTIKVRARSMFAAGSPPRPGEDVPLEPFERAPRPGEPYHWETAPRAYLYVTGDRLHSGVAEIDLAVERRGLISGSAMAAALIAALLFVLTAAASKAVENVDATVTLLVLVPALLGLIVVRQDEHPLVRRGLAGIRLLVLIAGSMPVVAAVALVTAGDHPRGSDVCSIWLGSAIVATVAAAALAFSLLLPPIKDPPPPA